MRLFVSVILSSDIKKELFNIQNKIPSNFAKIKWISKKNLHLTLKFIGEVNESVYEKIISRLNKIKFDSFEVELDNLSFLVRNKDIKVIWVDIFPKDKIIKIQQKIDQELLDLFKSDQTFLPHLTLGRVKFTKRKDKFLKLLKEIKIDKLKFQINTFCLVESKVTKDGSNYAILKEFNK